MSSNMPPMQNTPPEGAPPLSAIAPDEVDTAWAEACAARLHERDPTMTFENALDVARFMASQHKWHSMAPDAAADAVFEFEPGGRPARDTTEDAPPA